MMLRAQMKVTHAHPEKINADALNQYIAIMMLLILLVTEAGPASNTKAFHFKLLTVLVLQKLQIKTPK